jgi:hypothetical protein
MKLVLAMYRSQYTMHIIQQPRILIETIPVLQYIKKVLQSVYSSEGHLPEYHNALGYLPYCSNPAVPLQSILPGIAR